MTTDEKNRLARLNRRARLDDLKIIRDSHSYAGVTKYFIVDVRTNCVVEGGGNNWLTSLDEVETWLNEYSDETL